MREKKSMILHTECRKIKGAQSAWHGLPFLYAHFEWDAMNHDGPVPRPDETRPDTDGPPHHVFLPNTCSQFNLAVICIRMKSVMTAQIVTIIPVMPLKKKEYEKMIR